MTKDYSLDMIDNVYINDLTTILPHQDYSYCEISEGMSLARRCTNRVGQHAKLEFLSVKRQL